ncbi:pyocin knob domain-containing protein [Providencia stuartii]|uniref:pyocin knob domain-containing protein n=1 Tax=Providencia stuartii TaxID=588 RepID=UPI002AA0D5A7|nr:pyocin knob domain-containing protein [Providencia stuartii]
MYNVGTVTTTANSTKLIGVGTKWKENINLVLPMQMIQIQIGNTVHNNSIHSIQSNTELTLNFPIPTAQTGAKYVIFTTTMDSISAAANAIVAMNSSNVQFSDIQNRIMTESGVIDVKLPDGTVRKTRTEAERDKLLDGKFDKAGGTITGDVTFSKNAIKSTKGTHVLPDKYGTLMQVGDFGVGEPIALTASDNLGKTTKTGIYMQLYTGQATIANEYPFERAGTLIVTLTAGGNVLQEYRVHNSPGLIYYRSINDAGTSVNTPWISQYNTSNTTKDSNGNLKAASPIVKLFADHIELNEESEGVEMEHLGVGHYLIKGVVGFNSDGAWGINNGFVIPQDHNGKNMVLIDYEVRPDGDIEVFVFHQQNADMPERFQNKRIKYIDKDGNPVYYENYEPCDVPESRWIDVRVEMPVNSIYNLKKAEAERLAKEEAERQAEEEAKNAEIEAEEDI